MSSNTIPQVVSAFNSFQEKWDLVQVEMREWLNGTATGGPFGDGRYPLTDLEGVVHYVPCPAAFQSDVSNTLSNADGGVQAAESARDEAQGHRLDAEAARDTAQAILTSIQQEASTLTNVVQDVQSLVANAEFYQSSALTNASQAASERQAAEQALLDTQAETAQIETHKNDAETAATTAQTAATQAQDAASAAQAIAGFDASETELALFTVVNISVSQSNRSIKLLQKEYDERNL